MTRQIETAELPAHALSREYAKAGHYTDCFTTVVPISVSHAAFVEAFYTTRVFKLERVILKHAINKPSTDAEAAAVARGDRDTFAAWTVVGRATDQILLRDHVGMTMSWMRVEAVEGGTRLYFGSVVMRPRDPRTGEQRMKGTYRALLGFHRLYSVVLLGAARRRLLSR